MMKKYLLFAMAMVFGLGLSAKPVDLETARQLGGRFMQSKVKAVSAPLSLARTETTDSGLAVCYVFNLQPKGFVIVAADDRMNPILGYSTESSFDLVAAEAGPAVFLDAYRCDLMTAIEESLEQTEEVAAKWCLLTERGSLTGKGNRSVGPLLSSTWHQTQLYNYQCPEDPEGYDGHVKVGCVANAMSQIMRYWEWPKTGVGQHSYYCYGYGATSYGTLSANFGEADYRYELMPDFLDYTSPQHEVDAVALLEFHAGVSADMSYGPNASGAYSIDAIDAFIEYFRYSNDASYVSRDFYVDDDWMDMLKNEVDNGRPMYYSAYSYSKDGTRGGHAFVCDGYDENDFFHFNWGWQGFDNGFYSINGMDLTHHQYNYDHYVTTNLRPNEEYDAQPMPVSELTIEPWAYGAAVTITATAPSQTIGGMPLTSIDSVVVLMNGLPFYAFLNPQPGEGLEYQAFLDETDAGVKNYFTIYPVTQEGRGKTVVDTVAMWTATQAVSQTLTFHLHDASGDGWLSPAISILDDRGIVQHRIGLEEGNGSTVTVDIPVHRQLAIHWNYCNIGYEDDDDDCSFEVYDYKDELLYAQTTRPEVGALYSFYSDWNVVVEPNYITAEYQYREDGTFGSLVSWDIDEVNPWLDWFVVERYESPDGNPMEDWYIQPTEMEFFDEVAPGTYYYRLYAVYSAGGGIPTNTGFAPNLDDPDLDYAMVEVTSVEEWFDEGTASAKVYNMAGQMVYSGDYRSFDVNSLSTGVYVIRLTSKDGKQIAKKITRF